MVRFMRTAPSITPLATVYLRILLTGSTSTMLYNMGSAVLRAVGDSKRPLYFLIFTSLLNVVLDLYFVVSLKMSVAGAALATVMSQYVSAFLILFVLYRSHDVYQIRFRNHEDPRLCFLSRSSMSVCRQDFNRLSPVFPMFLSRPISIFLGRRAPRGGVSISELMLLSLCL